MTLQEFSTEFDVLFNNITSNQSPGLNEYEKTVFLTKAQGMLVKEYFNKNTDGFGGGFDGGEKRQYDFSSLIRTESLYYVNTFADRINKAEKLDRRSLVYLFPENCFLPVNEILSDDYWQYSVKPITYSEYQNLMLKPYNFPVKKGAWRLITDKKNCNFVREYIKKPVDGDPELLEEVDEEQHTYNTETDYTFLSTWADQKRNLRVTIKAFGSAYINNRDELESMMGMSESADFYQTYINEHDIPDASSSKKFNSIFYIDGKSNPCVIKVNNEWNDDKLTYIVNIEHYCFEDLDDEEVVESLKEGFKVFAEHNDVRNSNSTFAKVTRHIDGLANMTAPSNFDNFSISARNLVGKTFETKVIQIPIVEVIGKFKKIPQYKIRYVRTLKPIILDDLSNYGEDLTVLGETQPTECELPVETHQEILERAVTLAKIAWAGGTATQAAASSNK